MKVALKVIGLILFGIVFGFQRLEKVFHKSVNIVAAQDKGGQNCDNTHGC